MKDSISDVLSRHKTGYSLDAACYSDPDIYRLEVKSIFHKSWLYAGHASEIPNSGDYFVFNFDKESLILVRTGHGEIKAHANVCSHRGSHICLEKKGNKRLFTCPYHAWSFDLDGNLISARLMPDDFQKEDNGLRPVHVALVGGFIFVNLSEAPSSLDEMRTNLSGVFDIFGFDQLKLAHSESYAIEANWKLAVENYQECYHCTPSHQEYAKVHALARAPEEFQAMKAAYLDRAGDSIKTREFHCYFDLTTPGQEGYQYGRNPLLPGKVSGGMDGEGLAPFLGKISNYDGAASEFMVGPTMFFLIYDDHIVGYRFTPNSIRESTCDVYWYVNESAKQGADYNLAELTRLWDITTQADKKIIEDNQKGVESKFYQPGRLSTMEYFEQHFLNWYVATIKAAAAVRDTGGRF